MAPFYELEAGGAIFHCYFNACDASWMHAGTCVVVNRLGFELFSSFNGSALGKGEVFVHWAMGVACYDCVNIFVVVHGQLIELFVYFVG